MKSYIEIKDAIETGIVLNRMEDGDKIESIPQLCRKFGASDQTVQRALKELKDEGILFSRPGKGVFIKNRAGIRLQSSLLKIAVMDIDTPRFIDDAAVRFEKENPGIKVSWKSFDPGLCAADLIMDYAPDLVIFEESNVYSFMREDIWEYADDCFSPEDSYPQLLSGCLHNKRPLAVPVFFSPLVVAYNKKIVRDANVSMPENWDMKTFASIAEKLTKKSIENKVFGFILPHTMHTFPSLITAFGGNISNLGSSLSHIKKALDFSMDLLSRDISPLLLDGASDNYRLCFVEGYGAMRFDTYLGLKIRKKISFEWDLMPLPETDANGSSCFTAVYAGILKGGGNKLAARKFAGGLFSHETQKLLKANHFLLPARKEVCEDETIEVDEPCPANYYAFKREIPKMQPMHDFFRPEIKNLFTKEMFMFFNRIKTSGDVVETIAEELKKHP